MTILHYFLGFPPLHSGGLMIYVKDLVIEQQNKGHNILLLFPGVIQNYKAKSKIKYYKNYNGIKIFQLVNPQYFSFNGIFDPKKSVKDKYIKNIDKFLNKYRIEIIHVHSLMGFPKELLFEARKSGIKIIFSTHDYYGICPTINLYNKENKICIDYNEGNECIKCNNKYDKHGILKRNILISFTIFYKIFLASIVKFKSLYKIIRIIYKYFRIFKNKLIKKNENKLKNNVIKNIEYYNFRNYYINILKNFDLIIFNSYVTKETFSQYIDIKNIKYKVIPVTHSKIRDYRNIFKYEPLKDNKINFIYLGYLDHRKGFFDLINVLEDVKKEYSNWQLHIYADYSNIDIVKYDKDFYKFYGKYNYEDLSEIFSTASLIIVPSKWKETFGLIGLEAYSYGIPALVSENVGFSIVINKNKNGIVYKENKDNIYLKKSIINILEKPEILKEINQAILKNANFYDYLIENHTKQIIECYRNLINSGYIL